MSVLNTRAPPPEEVIILPARQTDDESNTQTSTVNTISTKTDEAEKNEQLTRRFAASLAPVLPCGGKSAAVTVIGIAPTADVCCRLGMATPDDTQ